MGYDMDYAYKICGLPNPSVSDVEAWNQLDGDTSNVSEVKVGLFGYDISCVATMCAQPASYDDAYYCDFIAARGLDGLTFGVQFKVDINAENFYCAGFHRAESSDHFVCAENDSVVMNYYFPQNYTVTDKFNTADGMISDYWGSTDWGYYGFSEFLFSYSYY